MNPKKDKVVFSCWATKTQAKQISDAIANDSWDDCRAIFELIFRDGGIEKR